LETNKKILGTNRFTLVSKNDILDTINKLKTLANKNIVIHMISFSHKSILIKTLQLEIKKVLPRANIVLLKNSEKSKISLTVYTLQNDMQTQDINNEILSKLYEEKAEKGVSIEKYRNKLFSRYFVDHLTNLPNVYQLRTDLDNNEDFSLIIFNIDNFQTINNFYGFIAGDYVIEDVGRQLKDNITDHKVYRMPSNEFALVINKNMFFYDLKDHLNKLYKQMSNIFVDYRGVNISLNITLASSSNIDNTNIFSNVSMALRHAKDIGAPFWIYEDEMNFENNYEKDITLSEVVKEAIGSLRIVPYYQAIVDTSTLKIKKYECLARLIDKNGRILSPLDFIPIAKKIKNYHIVTKTIIDKSFDTFESIKVDFTINLSIEDIINKEMFEFIMKKLKDSKIAPRVTFEILESDAIEDFEKVKRFISEVRRYGAKIAIDDFGSGYSNFSYLTKIKADYIKIDGSLVKNIGSDKNSFIIVETIVNFAKKLGIKTIAEYVHSGLVMDKAKELHIDYLQGYHIGKPSLLT
jgi:diguanylate cyclase (GGDEF)-like protein